MVLAGHFEHGGQPARAGEFYLRAAEQAHYASDGNAAKARAQRGLECGAQGDLRMALLGLLCEVNFFEGSMESTIVSYAEEVMRIAKKGSAPWARAAGAKLSGLLRSRRMAEFMGTLVELQGVDPEEDAISAMAFSFFIAMFVLFMSGQTRLADAVLLRFH
jgi:hypothetical protein